MAAEKVIREGLAVKPRGSDPPSQMHNVKSVLLGAFRTHVPRTNFSIHQGREGMPGQRDAHETASKAFKARFVVEGWEDPRPGTIDDTERSAHGGKLQFTILFLVLNEPVSIRIAT